jgi:hypothetical protein
MRKYLLALAVLFAIPAMLMAGPGVGTLAPDFSLPDTANVYHNLYDYSGKVVAMLFWQST